MIANDTILDHVLKGEGFNNEQNQYHEARYNETGHEKMIQTSKPTACLS